MRFRRENSASSVTEKRFFIDADQRTAGAVMNNDWRKAGRIFVFFANCGEFRLIV